MLLHINPRRLPSLLFSSPTAHPGTLSSTPLRAGRRRRLCPAQTSAVLSHTATFSPSSGHASAPSRPLGAGGSTWPVRDPEPGPRCGSASSAPAKGNCCRVPGLAPQLHLLSAERRSGLESKRLIDLAKAPFRNLLTSEMLSYEAKVMEKFS